MSAAITIGATVRHPSRGVGKVATLVINPLTKRPFKAWVEFPNIGFGNCTQRFICFVDDLVVVPCASPGPRPTLSVVAVDPAVA